MKITSIKDAAQEYCMQDGYLHAGERHKGFVAGAEWANKLLENKVQDLQRIIAGYKRLNEGKAYDD